MKVLCISFILVRIDVLKNLASDSSINQNWISCHDQWMTLGHNSDAGYQCA